MSIFGHSHKKNSKKGANMGQNPTPSKPQFQHPIAIGNIIEVY